MPSSLNIRARLKTLVVGKDPVKRTRSAPNSRAASPSPSGASSPACASSISITLDGRQNIALTTASPTLVDHDHELTSPITILVHPEPENPHENISQATASLSDVLSNSNNTPSILPPAPDATMILGGTVITLIDGNDPDTATTTAIVQTKDFVSQEATVVESNTATSLVDKVTTTPGADPTANVKNTNVVGQNKPTECTFTTDEEGAPSGNLPLQHESNQQALEIMQASLWEQAWRKLPTEIQNHFQFMLDQKDKRLEGLLLEAANVRQNCEGEKLTFDDGKKYKRIIVRDILDKLTTWVSKFVAVGDVLAQYDPAHAAIPWAIIRFILQSTIQHKERMGMVATSVEYIGRLVVRCVIYEELYLMGELASSVPYCNSLKVDLESLYQAILSFLVETAKYLDRTKICSYTSGRILHAILDPEALNGLLQAVQKSEKDIELHIQIIERTFQELRGQIAGDNYRKLEDILVGLEEPLQRVAMGVEGCYEFVNAQKRGGILNWITDNEYGVPHNLALKGLLDDTGKWFFDKEEYKEWRNASASSILWLHGIPGAGKTKLTCQVIKNLQSTHPQEVLCYFYCKRDGEAARRKPLTVVQAVVRQLSLQRPDGIPKSVLDLYDQHEKQGFATGKTSALQWTDCQELMIPLLNTNLQTNIVIDALDELDIESQDRQDLLELLTTLIRECHSLVKIFVSSRDDQDIVTELKNVPNLVIKARENIGDIERFIWREFEMNKKFSRPFWSKELKDKVYNELCKKANGMFQWVNLQLQFLGAMKLERDIHEKLGRLPKDLTEAYDQLYTLIENEEDHGREVAKGALCWVMCAQEPLTMQMLLEFTSYTAQNEVPAVTLLELCRNLLTWDEEKNMVQFCHLSVQEYLKESKLPEDEAHSILAKSCLLILSSDKPDDELMNQNSPPKYSQLRQYANYYWMEHAKNGSNSKFSDIFLKPLGSFLGNPVKPSGSYTNWATSAYTVDIYRSRYQILYGLRSYDYFDVRRQHNQFLSHPPNPLFLLVASNFGEAFLDELWPQWQLSCDYKTADTSGMTLLHIAASVGNDTIVARLLELGASVNCLDYKLESPLLYAARNGHKEILKSLLEHPAIDVKLRDENERTALSLVSYRGYHGCMELLLAHPAIDVNVQANGGSTALSMASNWGRGECVKLLLAHPAIDVNVQDENGKTALSIASYRGYHGCMELLLAHPAIDVNLLNNNGDTALVFAGYRGYDKCMKLLLAHPAIDVNVQDGNGRTALSLASDKGYDKCVKLLLAHPAIDVNVQDEDRRTALDIASRNGHDECVKLLLAHPAIDVNVQDKDGKTALSIASDKGYDQCVKLLLTHPAIDVNVQCKDGEVVLIIAVREDHDEWVKLLLTHPGIDVNVQDKNGDAALVLAIHKENEEAAELLLEHPALDFNANVHDKNGETVLFLAAWRGYGRVVHRLLKLPDIDVNMQNKNGETPLAAATIQGYKTIEYLLLQNGGNSNFGPQSMLNFQDILPSILLAALMRGTFDETYVALETLIVSTGSNFNIHKEYPLWRQNLVLVAAIKAQNSNVTYFPGRILGFVAAQDITMAIISGVENRKLTPKMSEFILSAAPYKIEIQEHILLKLATLQGTEVDAGMTMDANTIFLPSPGHLFAVTPRQKSPTLSEQIAHIFIASIHTEFTTEAARYATGKWPESVGKSQNPSITRYRYTSSLALERRKQAGQKPRGRRPQAQSRSSTTSRQKSTVGGAFPDPFTAPQPTQP